MRLKSWTQLPKWGWFMGTPNVSGPAAIAGRSAHLTRIDYFLGILFMSRPFTVERYGSRTADTMKLGCCVEWKTGISGWGPWNVGGASDTWRRCFSTIVGPKNQ